MTMLKVQKYSSNQGVNRCKLNCKLHRCDVTRLIHVKTKLLINVELLIFFYFFYFRYLDFLHEKPEYPCLLDAKEQVISFPPITNSDVTKISPETSEILVEVTSSRSLPICKSVMNTLLMEILNLGVGDLLEGDHSSGDKEPNYKLIVQQVRVLNEDSSLYAVYPSQVDIQEDSIQVIRE
eukprot:XP_014786346.1 PREDICTED: leucine-rich repeat-containing protein 47-like [Octopus bimaculoides]